MIVVLAASLFF